MKNNNNYMKSLESTLCFYNKIYEVYLDENYYKQIYPQTKDTEEGDYRKSIIDQLSNNILYKDDETKFYDFCDADNVRNELMNKECIEHIYRRLDENGRIYWCTAAFTVSERENNVPKTVVMTIRNIQDIMDKAKEQWKLLDNAKTIFFSNMSHDIRTPMNAILGYTGIAESNIDDRERVNEYLKKIKKAGNHLLELINGILDISRLESGKINIQMRECNIIELISNAVDMIAPQLRLKRINMHIDTEQAESADVYADTIHLNQIFINLLGNAVKFTEFGGDIYIGINKISEIPKKEVSYEFTIRDTGIGMEQDFLERLFEPFERENSVKEENIEGTGLGLAIVKRIVEVMNGEIMVESEKGKGTCFNIILKFEINTDVKKKQQAAPVKAVQNVNVSGRRVLLVDDNEMNREIANIMLSDKGYIVEEASDGFAAISMLEGSSDNYYDAVLLDIHMPVMDGYETTEKIRAMERSCIREIPIVAITSNAFDDDKRKTIEYGMNAHIAKPLDIGRLVEVLNNVIKF